MGFGIWLYNAVGRLRDGVSLDDARRELNALVPDVVRAFPGDAFAQANSSFLGVVSMPRTIKEAVVGDVSRALWIVLASVGLVLLMACANVANLFLVRSEARQRELAVRLATRRWASRHRAIFPGRERAAVDRGSRRRARGRMERRAVCWSRPVRRRSRGSVRYGWTAWRSRIRSL